MMDTRTYFGSAEEQYERIEMLIDILAQPLGDDVFTVCWGKKLSDTPDYIPESKDFSA